MSEENTKRHLDSKTNKLTFLIVFLISFLIILTRIMLQVVGERTAAVHEGSVRSRLRKYRKKDKPTIMFSSASFANKHYEQRADRTCLDGPDCNNIKSEIKT